jgi:pimeloyl-ACP methyl ester carboxylesterase
MPAVRHGTHQLVVSPGRTLSSEVWEPTDQTITETVFLLAGAGHPSGVWAKTGTSLAQQGMRAIAPNVRGHGHGDLLSQWDHPVAKATMEDYVDDIAHVIEECAAHYGLARGQYSIVGHSLGGGEACIYVSQHPVNHFILVGSAAMDLWLGVYGGVSMRLMFQMPGALLTSIFQGADLIFWDPAHPQRAYRARHTLFNKGTDSADVAALLALLQPESASLFSAFRHYATKNAGNALREGILRNTQDRAIIGFGDDRFFGRKAVRETVKAYAMGDRWTVIPGAPHDGFADRRYAPAFHTALGAYLRGERAPR